MEGKYIRGDSGVYGKIILKTLLETKSDVWNGFIWLEIQTSVRLF
jgi:hypothetical protein